MKPTIDTLSIEGFRALRRIRIEGLGRANLITGRNNTGKSSVLEALRILASNASPPVISNILHYREEDIGESEETARSAESEGFSLVSSLFSGFPSLGETSRPIAISASGSAQSKRLSLSLGRFTEQRNPDGTRRLIPHDPGLLPETEPLLRIVLETDEGRRPLPLDYFSRYRTALSARGEWPGGQREPCVFVSPYASENTSALGSLWDKVALSDLEEHVVRALRLISPDVEAVSMIGGEGPRQSRIAIVRIANTVRPVPLRSLGDGVNRLFGIVLSLVNAKDGLLLIDEVENGLHHGVQMDVWRAIFDLSRRLNVQVFATSHSWDSVEAFQKVSADDPEVGVLIRLSRKGDEIIPTLFREHELAIATRDRIEVR